MKLLRASVLTDGSSDRALIPILDWTLRQRRVPCILTWADLRAYARAPTLAERIEHATTRYPCEILFVHRDAERQAHEARVAEISAARAGSRQCVVCVVPVKMQEAWLLFHEPALRQAAGNPRGRVALELPKLAMLERVADPKTLLHDLLRQATELTGRRLDKFRPAVAVHRLAQLIDDFTPLRQLPAFAAFEQQLDQALAAHGQP